MNTIDTIMALADDYADAFGECIRLNYETWHSDQARKDIVAMRDQASQKLLDAVTAAIAARVPEVAWPNKVDLHGTQIGSAYSNGWNECLSDCKRAYNEAMLAAAPQPEAARVPDGWKLLKDSTHAERSYHEDTRHENGCYNNVCVHCGRGFAGHKRRAVCKVCAAAPQPAQAKWVGLTDADVVSSAARVLSDRVAASCNVDCGDQWNMYGSDFIEDARAMLEEVGTKLREKNGGAA